MRWRLGVDENGLGPQLGPLVVTAVLARLDDEGVRRMSGAASTLLHERLADSKQLVAHNDIALGEAWARAACRTMTGAEPASRDALLEALSLRGRAYLRQNCPDEAGRQCWSAVGPFEATAAQVQQAEADLRRLRELGVEVVWARCEIVCTKRLNDARARGLSRLLVDLGAMESLVVAARAHAKEELVAVCGKVGGIRAYPPRFGPLGDSLQVTLRETAGESAYRIAGVGEVRFVRDADGSDPLVALSSLIGKYVREDLMARIVTYYRAMNSSLPDASGYHDPVTERFVRDTAELRGSKALPEACFLRERERKEPR